MDLSKLQYDPLSTLGGLYDPYTVLPSMWISQRIPCLVLTKKPKHAPLSLRTCEYIYIQTYTHTCSRINLFANALLCGQSKGTTIHFRTRHSFGTVWWLHSSFTSLMLAFLGEKPTHASLGIGNRQRIPMIHSSSVVMWTRD